MLSRNPNLIQVYNFTVTEIRRQQKYLLELLESKDEGVRLETWDSVNKLPDYGLFTRDDAKDFLKFLESNYEDVREYAKGVIKELIKREVLTRVDLFGL